MSASQTLNSLPVMAPWKINVWNNEGILLTPYIISLVNSVSRSVYVSIHFPVPNFESIHRLLLASNGEFT
jgi:hypothetical protein